MAGVPQGVKKNHLRVFDFFQKNRKKFLNTFKKNLGKIRSNLKNPRLRAGACVNEIWAKVPFFPRGPPKVPFFSFRLKNEALVSPTRAFPGRANV